MCHIQMHVKLDHVSLGLTGLTFSSNPNNINIYQPNQLRLTLTFFS